MCWRSRASRRDAALALALLAAGCGGLVAERLRGDASLVGLPADDLRLCAGLPDRVASTPSGEFWTYDHVPPNTGVSLPVPVVGGAVNFYRVSDCRVTFRVVEGRVLRVGHNAASGVLGRDAACAPVVRGCLRRSPGEPEE
jgi:hypothetical protein